MNLSQTALRAIEAYGGADLWTSHKFVEAKVSAKGLAFTIKQRPFFEHAKIKMEIERPFSRITPIGKDKSITGILDGNDVRLENVNGDTISERKNAKEGFPYGRRLFYWDDLDMAYFAHYAFWNYFTFPYLLMNDRIKWTEKEEGVLSAIFPDNIPTHSMKEQEYYFDKQTGQLYQYNYAAEVISGLAKAANVVTAHKQFEQGIFPSSRKVTPQNGKGKALKRPTLIDITIHDFKLTNNEW
ncbi:MAG: hypothetical protein IPK35_19175 [Saprospiraceae bacterium]|nr:hypothetical protein [Saprospiraceae bacterium]